MLMTHNKKVKHRQVPCRKKIKNRSHLPNQNYVEIWNRFNHDFV